MLFQCAQWNLLQGWLFLAESLPFSSGRSLGIKIPSLQTNLLHSQEQGSLGRQLQQCPFPSLERTALLPQHQAAGDGSAQPLHAPTGSSSVCFPCCTHTCSSSQDSVAVNIIMFSNLFTYPSILTQKNYLVTFFPSALMGVFENPALLKHDLKTRLGLCFDQVCLPRHQLQLRKHQLQLR